MGDPLAAAGNPQLVADPAEGGPVGVAVGEDAPERDAGPLQGGGDPGVTGAADQSAGDGVVGAGETDPELVGEFVRRGVPEEAAEMATTDGLGGGALWGPNRPGGRGRPVPTVTARTHRGRRGASRR